ncbi:unnamed protein product, partial [Phaeothamnion confervicola]
DSFRVATKANPWYRDGRTTDTPAGGLRPELVEEQLRKSLKALKTDKVELFYLHAPDHDTPIEATLAAVNALHQEGLFSEWGLSNFAAWQVVQIYYLCQMRGWCAPVVYQGMYNAVTRAVEAELLPALRECGMRFNAYNPLAGGILTGRYGFDDDPQSGRFSGKTVWGGRYRRGRGKKRGEEEGERFWRKATFDAIDELRLLCAAHDTSLTSASLRWLRFHSVLDGEKGDGVVIGGSSVEHIRSNVEASVEAAPLPEDVLAGFDRAWEAARRDCPQYFR